MSDAFSPSSGINGDGYDDEYEFDNAGDSYDDEEGSYEEEYSQEEPIAAPQPQEKQQNVQQFMAQPAQSPALLLSQETIQSLASALSNKLGTTPSKKFPELQLSNSDLGIETRPITLTWSGTQSELAAKNAKHGKLVFKGDRSLLGSRFKLLELTVNKVKNTSGVAVSICGDHLPGTKFNEVANENNQLVMIAAERGITEFPEGRVVYTTQESEFQSKFASDYPAYRRDTLAEGISDVTKSIKGAAATGKKFSLVPENHPVIDTIKLARGANADLAPVQGFLSGYVFESDEVRKALFSLASMFEETECSIDPKNFYLTFSRSSVSQKTFDQLESHETNQWTDMTGIHATEKGSRAFGKDFNRKGEVTIYATAKYRVRSADPAAKK